MQLEALWPGDEGLDADDGAEGVVAAEGAEVVGVADSEFYGIDSDVMAKVIDSGSSARLYSGIQTQLYSGLPARLYPDRLEAGCDEAGRGPLVGPVFAAAVILPPDFHHPLLNDSKKMTPRSRELLREVIMREALAYAVEAVSAEEIDRINILNASITGIWRAVLKLPIRPEFLAVDGNKFKPYSALPIAAQTAQQASAQAAVQAFSQAAQQASAQTTLQASSQTALPPAVQASPQASLLASPATWAEESTAGVGVGQIPYECIVKGDGKYADIAAASVLAKTGRDDYMRQLALEYPQYGWDKNMGYPTKEHVEAIRKYGLTPHHRRSFHLKELEPTLF